MCANWPSTYYTFLPDHRRAYIFIVLASRITHPRCNRREIPFFVVGSVGWRNGDRGFEGGEARVEVESRSRGQKQSLQRVDRVDAALGQQPRLSLNRVPTSVYDARNEHDWDEEENDNSSGMI